VSWSLIVVRGLSALLGFFFRVLLVAWATLAIYYSNLPWEWGRLLLAAGFFVASVWALLVSRTRRASFVFAALFLGVVAWFISISPSQNREWKPEVTVVPRAIIDGDHVRLTGVRNFDYRTVDDFTPHYEEREVSISHLTGVDFFISYWMPGPIGHTFVSFIFDNAPPVCISIEVRARVGQSYAPVGSMFKQFELIYVVGEERDVVGVRTNHRDEDVYLYRLQTPAESARRLFLVYLDRINKLADEAEFYNLLSNSCTINIIRYANAAGRVGRLDFRHVLNGLIDRYLYGSGRLDTTLPFEELRRRSHINEAARAAGDGPDFAQRIRESLPGIQPAPL
jgi:hypothetical protein